MFPATIALCIPSVLLVDLPAMPPPRRPAVFPVTVLLAILAAPPYEM